MKSFNKIFLSSVVAGLICASVFAMEEDKKNAYFEQQMREYRENNKRKEMQRKQELAAQQQAAESDYTLSLDDTTLLTETVPNMIGHPKITAELWNAIKNVVRFRNTSQRNRNLLTNKVIVDILKEAGFEINSTIENLEPAVKGFTPLQVAIIDKLYGTVNILLMLGANVNLSPKEPRSTYKDTRPLLARTQGKYDIFTSGYKGIENCETPLKIAVMTKQSNIIKVLIKKGAKLNYAATSYLLNRENRELLNDLLKNECLDSSQIKELLDNCSEDDLDTQRVLSNYIPSK